MPVIKVDLPQEVLEKLATFANRHMVETRVMAGDVIAAYLNAAQQSVQADECLCSSDKKHDFRTYTMAHVELCEWCGTRR